jgi:DNA-binding PadR family transcriptional regulator
MLQFKNNQTGKMDISEKLTDFLPLREPTFFILLSLAPNPQSPITRKHGYAIMQDVEKLSAGKIHLSTGTLYEGLARLLKQGLIERVDEEADPSELEHPAGAGAPKKTPGPHPGKPRKAYRLTHLGQQVLAAEAHRMEELVKIAERRLGLQMS